VDAGRLREPRLGEAEPGPQRHQLSAKPDGLIGGGGRALTARSHTPYYGLQPIAPRATECVGTDVRPAPC
jgi:hypothetical protein